MGKRSSSTVKAAPSAKRHRAHGYEAVSTRLDADPDICKPYVRDAQSPIIMAEDEEPIERPYWVSESTAIRMAAHSRINTLVSGRTWQSLDLVEHVFGRILPIPLVTSILLDLLRLQMLSVSLNEDAAPCERCRPAIVSVPIHAFGKRSPPALPPHFHSLEPCVSKIQSPLSPIRLKKQIGSFPSNVTEMEPEPERVTCDCTLLTLQRQLQQQLLSPLPHLPDVDGFDFTCIDTDYICWKSFATTAEIGKSDDFRASLSQSMIYMQQQCLAQPHLRSVLGLTKSPDRITLTRADAMGVEHGTFDVRSGWGVVETVRLALGFAIADDETLGHLPGFELQEQRCLRYVDPPAKSQFMKNRGPIFSPTSIGVATKTSWSIAELTGEDEDADNLEDDAEQEKPNDFEENAREDMKCARVPLFFTVSRSGDRYYLDFPIHIHGAFGRMTRVWCAYRQLSRHDQIAELVDERDRGKAEAELKSGKEVYCGPYALKIQNDSVDSVASREKLVAKIKEAVDKEAKEGTGAMFILAPEQTYNNGNITKLVRGFETCETPLAARGCSQREEIITVSLFKRTLSQYKSFGEVARAIADGYRAIKWMESKGWLHRDISNGNLLLANEEPSSFSEPFSPHPNILLCRRLPSNPANVYGLLHDFDTSGVVNDPSPLDKNNPTGTAPYIPLRILWALGGPRAGSDDAQSLFFVAYLFPFDNEPPAEIFSRNWPEQSLRRRSWDKFITALYKCLWLPDPTGQCCTPLWEVDIQSVIDSLDAFIASDGLDDCSGNLNAEASRK
ncbi:other/FunK1 protein kinase [Coprinopsis cinerea okayama7|uniref:Other/FunK1 protein kinase n=1 Tax=Coprinopsis cinerea (strain Okayama-7 / 130 / ATCC MYA-4618 / FGSC 9003) TaxID=240176 RepID=A8P5S2_COPC7|nr:other/FunK1 protein kinase [Coprinopsis cinerea okayama7\|eukprot:XP_001839010.2 other/FunK1 protein kinase [Coprinopsis cinerea okayama7\